MNMYRPLCCVIPLTSVALLLLYLRREETRFIICICQRCVLCFAKVCQSISKPACGSQLLIIIFVRLHICSMSYDSALRFPFCPELTKGVKNTLNFFAVGGGSSERGCKRITNSLFFSSAAKCYQLFLEEGINLESSSRISVSWKGLCYPLTKMIPLCGL